MMLSHLDDLLLISILIAGCGVAARATVRRTPEAWIAMAGVGIVLAMLGGIFAVYALGLGHDTIAVPGATQAARVFVATGQAMDGGLAWAGLVLMVGGLTTTLSSTLSRVREPIGAVRWFEERTTQAAPSTEPLKVAS